MTRPACGTGFIRARGGKTGEESEKTDNGMMRSSCSRLGHSSRCGRIVYGQVMRMKSRCTRLYASMGLALSVQEDILSLQP